MKLTPALIAEITGETIQEIKSLDVSNKQITHIDDISVCVALKKLDLSKNSLESKESLSGIQYSKGLTMLNLSHNSISSIETLKNLQKLVVLNLSNNKFVTIPLIIRLFNELKVLVLNNNELGSIPPELQFSSQINTIILSNNSIDDITNLVGKKLGSLTKLSLAFNQIRALPPSMREELPELKELRLANNKISRIELNNLPYLLEILDLSNNLISTLDDIRALSCLKNLIQVSFKGCPICTSLPCYKEEIRRLLPTLRILDGERFDEKFMKRKRLKMEKTSANKRK